jgi:hypothetical protein
MLMARVVLGLKKANRVMPEDVSGRKLIGEV